MQSIITSVYYEKQMTMPAPALLAFVSFPACGHRKECLSELLGTYLLVFIGPASVVVASLVPNLSSLGALTSVAAVFGCTVASLIILLGKHSGAHINPAISVANAVAGTLRKELLLPYIAFQLLGGLLAGLSLRIVFDNLASTSYLGSTRLAAGITPIEGIILEIAGTFALAISAMFASSFIRNPVCQGILVGSTLFALIMLIGPLTGASFNPARSIGPSIFSGYFSGQVVYWVGPLAGAGLAGLTFGASKRHHGQRR